MTVDPDMWKHLIAAMTPGQRREFFKWVLRSRRKCVPFGLNGTVWHMPRAEVRDYLRAIL